MNIVVCVGSSCYSKDSCGVIRELRKLIQKYDLSDVTVSASFCLGHCSREGVAVEIDGERMNGVTAENAKNIFEKCVLSSAACSSR